MRPPPGVEAFDHTADVGIRVAAPDLPELFRRAGLGAIWMAVGQVPSEVSETRTLRLEAGDVEALLRSWVRELLYWQEVEGFAAGEIQMLSVDGTQLEARVQGGAAPEHPVREIKGVTWHGLSVEEAPGDCRAQVIFDV
jgi:SHS2 domain-containing protein